jgi:hypothetical protein
MRPRPPEPGAVLGAIKTEPLRGSLPAHLDSRCARRLRTSAWQGRGEALSGAALEIMGHLW